MNRDRRLVIVLLVAVGAGGLAAYAVLQYLRSIPVRQVEVTQTYTVVASRPLPTGTRLASADVKVVPWPASAPVPGAFDRIEAVVDRGVLAPLALNEPLTENKLAPVEAGAGLSPTIPAGMRAISVQVNEVVGVAGFVTPGTRVDVFATLRKSDEGVTRVVVSNVQVLTAGTRYDQDKSQGEAIPSSVVTLLLTPADAERVVLAAAEGQIMLALRNPLDVEATTTDGTRTAALLGSAAPAVVPVAVPRPARPKAVEPPPPPPEPPKVYTVETIRAAKRTEEPIR